mgnify:CR=1 FL=1
MKYWEGYLVEAVSKAKLKIERELKRSAKRFIQRCETIGDHEGRRESQHSWCLHKCILVVTISQNLTWYLHTCILVVTIARIHCFFFSILSDIYQISFHSSVFIHVLCLCFIVISINLSMTIRDVQAKVD